MELLEFQEHLHSKFDIILFLMGHDEHLFARYISDMFIVGPMNTLH